MITVEKKIGYKKPSTPCPESKLCRIGFMIFGEKYNTEIMVPDLESRR